MVVVPPAKAARVPRKQKMKFKNMNLFGMVI